MLVYGDHIEHVEAREELRLLDEQLRALPSLPRGLDRHSRLVGALIRCGQLAQALADAEFAVGQHDRRTPITDELGTVLLELARAVCRSWYTGFQSITELPRIPDLAALPDRVELRVPEGFAFYAVYPEAYVDAARRLTLEGPPQVIGIRSIGTTLGAVVAAALGAAPPGTLRPFGDPFDRHIAMSSELERDLLKGDAHYVIVDEGPGQSGSSFGAVADWLQEHGVALDRIAFIPSHAGSPGPQASATHLRLWHSAQRSVGTFRDDLPHLLQQWAEPLLGGVTAPFENISAGGWRRQLYPHEDDWPAAMPMWERLKFLADTRDGRVLLKFAGLGAIGEGKLEMARALHAAALTPEPLGLVHGFLAERWCEDARPLATGDRPAAEIGRYVGARARLFPAEAWSGASLKRLLEMSRRNLSLGLGGSAAPLLTHWESRIASLSPRVHRVRTDNRLDCHEWLRVDGRLIKTDALDHCAAHDLIGCQDLAWDVAGAIAEFELDDGSTSDLIVAAEHASGRQVDLELLEFYQLAYLAFRLGQTHLAAGMCADEKQRLEPVEQGYRAKLQHLLWIASQARLGLSPRSIDERNEPAREQTFVPIG